MDYSAKRILDVLPLTKILDVEHMHPSPAMTLMSLQSTSSSNIISLHTKVHHLKSELQFWRRNAILGRNMLKAIGVAYDDSWDDDEAEISQK
jgi:hypothetical protein